MGSPGSELSPGVKGRELPGPAPMEMNAPDPPGGPEQVERANAEILNGLKTCTYDGLKKHGNKWIDELPCALWGNRTSPSQATGETSFFMVYGAEVVLPLRSHHVLCVCQDI
jgi:hypothetical protein